MNLGFDDNGTATQLVDRLLNLVKSENRHPFGHRDPGLLEKRLGLVFMYFHYSSF
jgi:hypothetical protein